MEEVGCRMLIIIHLCKNTTKSAPGNTEVPAKSTTLTVPLLFRIEGPCKSWPDRHKKLRGWEKPLIELSSFGALPENKPYLPATHNSPALPVGHA